MAATHQITHLIPVVVMPPESLQHLNEPRCPEPTVNILLPPLRHISERYRTLSQYIILWATSTGELKLGVQTENVVCDTHWRDLLVPQIIEENPTQSRSSGNSVYEGSISQGNGEESDKTGNDGPHSVSQRRLTLYSKDWSNALRVEPNAKRIVACKLLY